MFQALAICGFVYSVACAVTILFLAARYFTRKLRWSQVANRNLFLVIVVSAINTICGALAYAPFLSNEFARNVENHDLQLANCTGNNLVAWTLVHPPIIITGSLVLPLNALVGIHRTKVLAGPTLSKRTKRIMKWLWNFMITTMVVAMIIVLQQHAPYAYVDETGCEQAAWFGIAQGLSLLVGELATTFIGIVVIYATRQTLLRLSQTRTISDGTGGVSLDPVEKPKGGGSKLQNSVTTSGFTSSHDTAPPRSLAHEKLRRYTRLIQINALVAMLVYKPIVYSTIIYEIRPDWHPVLHIFDSLYLPFAPVTDGLVTAIVSYAVIESTRAASPS